jgi:hypothetical protein
MTFREATFYLVVSCLLIVSGLAIWGFRLRKLWLKWLVRVAGVLILVPLTSICLIGFAFQSFQPKTSPSLKSPGGHFTARLQFGDGGAISQDFASVSVRRSWSPIAEEVYTGTIEPQIRWLDERTLEIRYPLQLDKTSCGGSWMGVKIVCQETFEQRN